jgi:hypothetical protein
MAKLRQDWIDEVKAHPTKYSYWLPRPGKWYANVPAIMGGLACTRATAKKLEAILDYQILPSLPAPTSPQREPEGNNTRNIVDPNMPYTINKEYLGSEDQIKAYIPPGTEDKVRSVIFKPNADPTP